MTVRELLSVLNHDNIRFEIVSEIDDGWFRLFDWPSENASEMMQGCLDNNLLTRKVLEIYVSDSAVQNVPILVVRLAKNKFQAIEPNKISTDAEPAKD